MSIVGILFAIGLILIFLDLLEIVASGLFFGVILIVIAAVVALVTRSDL